MAATRLRLTNIFSNNLQLFGARVLIPNQTNIRQNHAFTRNSYKSGMRPSITINKSSSINPCK